MNPFDDFRLEPGWADALADVLEQSCFGALNDFLRAELAAGKQILPPPAQWFRAFNATPMRQVRVVVIGQDPYPTPGHANGLCFSVRPDVKPLPKSLINIFRELRDDLGIDNENGSLSAWAEQGVLLLNTVLTTECGKPGSHRGKGWERFTDRVVAVLDRQPRPLAFVLWGNHAQLMGRGLDRQRHLVIEAPHPSPLSAYRGFFGSRPFSTINAFLERNATPQIDWRTGVDPS
ncbi:MAG: uracil-DNA glycosylase [Thiotrichales bacterium]